MLMGQFQHSLDSKGRLIIPARFRKTLGTSFVLTKGLDSCLFVYPKEEWKILQEKLKTLPFTQKEVRAFIRFFFAGAVETKMDKQGRILIPQQLRDHAFIKKDVIIIGILDRVEIWSKEKWAVYSNKAASCYEDIAEKLDLGI